MATTNAVAEAKEEWEKEIKSQVSGPAVWFFSHFTVTKLSVRRAPF